MKKSREEEFFSKAPERAGLKKEPLEQGGRGRKKVGRQVGRVEHTRGSFAFQLPFERGEDTGGVDEF